jgi:hypothetical protein
MQNSCLAMMLLLVCAGCAHPSMPPVVTNVTVAPNTAATPCRDYSLAVTNGDKPQTVLGHACKQPDGSWRITEGPPEAPAQFQTVYWPPDAVDYDDAPWLWDAPFGFSLGFPFFLDVHRHFHAFGHLHGGNFGHFGMAGFSGRSHGFHH